MNIALYGKGGIGKSTIASNIAAYYAASGLSILQIGCDPKHDSTLMHLENGQTIHTVIDSMDTDIPESEVIVKGRYGITCIEVGGPEPGLGCAGRGIISGLQVLEQMTTFQELKKDFVIYDILGDVVCGGFFEPLKRRKVDAMYIVTSGEFNSMFAANNICKGYLNCCLYEKGIHLSGIIGNGRGIPREEEFLQIFCERIGVPLVTFIPRDNRIEECTIRGVPVVEYYRETDIYYRFETLCTYMKEKHGEQTIPTPLELNELRNLFRRAVLDNE